MGSASWGFPQYGFQLGLARRRCQWKAGEGEEKRNCLPHFDAALPSRSPSPPQQLPLGLSLGFGSTVSSQGPLARTGNGIQHPCSLGTSLWLICFLSPDHTPNIAFPLKALFKLSGVKFIFLLNSTDTVALTWVVVRQKEIHGILQARILECVAFLFSRVSSQPRDQTQVSHTADRFFTS